MPDNGRKDSRKKPDLTGCFSMPALRSEQPAGDAASDV